MNAAPYEMLKFFEADDDDELEIVEVAGDDGVWLAVAPFFPDATLTVVLWQKGVKRIAVRLRERVAEFDVYHLILRDGTPVGVDR